MCTKLYFALVAFLALCYTDARAAMIEHIQTVEHVYTFERAQDAIVLDSHYPNDDGFTARESTVGGYAPVFQFGFTHPGLEVLDLGGTTIDFATFFASPPGPLEFPWASGIIDSWTNLSGFVTFGAGNEIVEWHLSAWGEPGFRWEDRAQSSHVDPSQHLWSDVDNADAYLGREVYGELYSAPHYFVFPSRPGRWSASVSRSCYTEKDGEYLASESCPSPVPLPPSAMLLLSGFGLIVVQARRASMRGARTRASVEGTRS